MLFKEILASDRTSCLYRSHPLLINFRLLTKINKYYVIWLTFYDENFKPNITI